MHLTRIRLGGVPPFTQPIQLTFDERVNILTGPNASGKTTVLLILAECLNWPEKNSKRPLSGGKILHTQLPADYEFDEAVSGEWSNSKPANAVASSEDWHGTSEKPPIIYVGSVREGLPGVSEVENADAYGDTAEKALAGPFSGSRTMCAIALLGGELRNTKKEEEPLTRGWLPFQQAIELSDACSKRICNEVITDSESYNYVHGWDVRGYLQHPDPNPNLIPIKARMGIKTTDIRNFEPLPYEEQPSYSAYTESPDSVPLYLGHLSSGTEGTLLWIRWLVIKMLHHYGFERGWEKKPAILLIDEIENHLHPTWQRRVIPALLEHFPGLQIFATTHSPFVVAGLKTGQVHLLKRDKNGVVTASTNTADVVGWTADEILRNMMGVDEPTDQLTVDRANRLRQLREKDSLTPDEESELKELRHQVNEDLLSKGGPLEAQRERYADLMEQFLLSRQSELSQDGSD